MGACISKVGDSKDYVLTSVSYGSADYSSCGPEESVKSTSSWKTIIDTRAARAKFLSDTTLQPDAPDSMFELRLLLHDYELLGSLSEFCSNDSDGAYDNLMCCWIHILSFEGHTDSSCSKEEIALKLYEKYGSTLSKSFISFLDWEEVRLKLTVAPEVKLSDSFFDDVKRQVFIALYEHVWPRFRVDVKYLNVLSLLRSYNKVDMDDFLYLEEVGQGHYGFVVHAKKMSTGKDYAIKIQHKATLLNTYSDCPYRVSFERKVSDHDIIELQ